MEKQQFLYLVKVQNKHTGDVFVKLGYTGEILRRRKELSARNEHYEYSEYILFRHDNKSKGYFYDEQTIHDVSSPYRARINRYAMPDGYTECYEYAYIYTLIECLHTLGYRSVYDELPESVQPPQMFAWN